MSKVIGIDLGTGNSCVAVIEGGKATVIANAEGNRTTPSVVLLKDSEREVGSSAKRKMTMNPKNTVSFIKRFMGAQFTDPDVQKMLKQISYEVINDGGKPRVRITNADGSTRTYSAEEISSYILTKMKKTAEDYYGCEVKDAVITCPAWFNDTQRQATKLAGELAGLNVLRVINEPTAAILASNIDIKEGEEKTVAVVDAGCGTTDVSICEMSRVDGQLVVEIAASYGDVFLGGVDFDNAITDWLITEFKSEHGVDLKKDPQAYARIIEAAEKAKCELSSTTSSEINLPYITQVDGVPAHLVKTLTRAKYEQLTAHLVDKIVECTRVAIEKAGKTTSDINEILLVGGLTRSLNIQDALTKTFGLPLDKSANPDESVALGAVTQANIIAGGSASQDILLLDVTPISLGIETEGEVMTKLIEANTTIPTSKKETFTTAVDNQPAVTIKILQGERQFSRDNKTIGMFTLDGIMPARRGVPQIEVTFDIDANGILKVSAVDKGTGKEQHITVNNSNALTPEEIERIKKDAEAHEAEDKRAKEELDKFNAAEGYAYQVRNAMDDEKLKDFLSTEQKDTITKKVDAVLEAVKEKDLVKTETVKKELEEYFMPIMTSFYQQQNPQSAPQEPVNENQSATGEKPSDEKVDDVPFEEVK